MKREEYTIMAACNKAGIRIYPVLQYGYYYLEVEFNRSSEFNRYERIGKPKRGEIKHATDSLGWVQAMLDKYKELYEEKVKPKLNVA